MKIIDFERKGNVVRFYLGADDRDDFTGDDWNDIPYEHNAGRVGDEYIVGHRDIAFPFDFVVLEPKDPEWQHNSHWCKDDMKARKVPCIIAIENPDYWHDDEFDYYLGDERTIKFYFGDKMEPENEMRAPTRTLYDFKEEKNEPQDFEPAKVSLCRNCQCMTHTLVGNVCGKCLKPKNIAEETKVGRRTDETSGHRTQRA